MYTPMASSSSSSSTRQYSYDVFPSFSSQDVGRTFLSHFLEKLKSKGIKTFQNNGIMRSEYITSEIARAIKESRISVVILSKNYPSSSWCLNELQRIMECKVSLGQTVMTIFYDVDPYDVRKQTGDFGKAFEETCDGKTAEQKRKWRRALRHVALIAGEHSVSWASDAKMISKIVMDVSNVLPSTDYDHLVGIEAHVEKLKAMMCLESDEVLFVGIWGPAGIGKTTIARALYNQVSKNFQLKFYKEARGSDYNAMGILNQLLSGMLDHRDMKIPNQAEAIFRLMHQRVLLVLDDVSIEELQALHILIQSYFLRFGSKVIVTTEDIYTLRHYGIEKIYKVAYPLKEEALEIFSFAAFGQRTPPRGYLKDDVDEVTKLIGHPFPLALKILGSALRGKRKEEWTIGTVEPARLNTYLVDKDIQKAIIFAHDGLSKEHKSLFYSLRDSEYWGKNLSNAKYSLAANDWDVENGLQTLANMALISISGEGEITMHNLVQRMARDLYYKNKPKLNA